MLSCENDERRIELVEISNHRVILEQYVLLCYVRNTMMVYFLCRVILRRKLFRNIRW